MRYSRGSSTLFKSQNSEVISDGKEADSEGESKAHGKSEVQAQGREVVQAARRIRTSASNGCGVLFLFVFLHLRHFHSHHIQRADERLRLAHGLVAADEAY